MSKLIGGGSRLRWLLVPNFLAAAIALLAVVFTSCNGSDSSPSASDGSDVVTRPPGTATWKTDWSKAIIDLDELVSGGPARDGIPPIDSPAFETVDEASQWLEDREPVVLLRLGEDVRAYPLRILTWHEIVNDTVDGVPVAITFCPLCNSAIAFDRRLDGDVLRFGTSGLLRNSDLVMWDDKTESLWQQLDGTALVGDFAGRQLEFLPAAIVPWGDLRQQFPQAQVLSRQTGFPFQEAAYGTNPYQSYDTRETPFGRFFEGEPDPRLPAMERVVAVTIGEDAKAYPFSVLALERVVHDQLDGEDIVVFWGASDTASALDDLDVAAGRAVGAATVWKPVVDGQRLTFRAEADSRFLDEETGTAWSLLGQAIDGPLEGSQLEPVVHGTHFWFAWAAFQPDTSLYEGQA
jgi:hypothetical protein